MASKHLEVVAVVTVKACLSAVDHLLVGVVDAETRTAVSRLGVVEAQTEEDILWLTTRTPPKA